MNQSVVPSALEKSLSKLVKKSKERYFVYLKKPHKNNEPKEWEKSK